MADYKVKEGVDISNLHVEVKSALVVVCAIYDKYGYNVTITSGNDGKHMNGSKHYTNDAADLRIWGLEDDGFLGIIGNEIQSELDKTIQGFQLVIEGNHYHLEYDPTNWYPGRQFKY